MSTVETAPHSPERMKTLRHWDMEAQHSHPETHYALINRIRDRLRVWQYADKDSADYPDSFLPVIAETGANGLTDASKFEMQAAYEWSEATNANKGWWNRLRMVSDYIPDDIFKKRDPTEQFIVGQEDKGVRFYNFAEPLSEDQQDDLQAFMDAATQIMGDRTYDVLQDVVIVDFMDEERGLTFEELKGVIFINASALKKPLVDGGDTQGSQLLQTLGHEFDHVIDHQETESTRTRNLGEFATEIGWPGTEANDSVERLIAYYPPAVFGSDAKEVRSADGHGHALAQAEYVSRYEPSIKKQSVRDEQGNLLEPLIGSPTEYGSSDPMESAAESTRHAMFGRFMFNHLMPETRDAWLDLTRKRRRGDIVVPLDREPIAIERRIGDDILYPRATLPKTIDIQLVPAQESEQTT